MPKEYLTYLLLTYPKFARTVVSQRFQRLRTASIPSPAQVTGELQELGVEPEETAVFFRALLHDDWERLDRDVDNLRGCNLIIFTSCGTLQRNSTQDEMHA